MQDEDKKILKRVAYGIVGCIVLVILLGSFTLIGAGQRGVVLNLGAVQDRIMNEGFNFKIPFIQSVKKIDVKTQTVSFDGGEAMGAASKDLQDVTMNVVVNYHQDISKVNKIYQEYGKSYQMNVIEPIIRETVKSVASQYTAEELVTKRTEVSDKISFALTTVLASKNAIVERFSIVNFSFSQSFNQAIEAKVTAEQDALAAKNKLEQVKYEAEQRVATAKGEAEAIKIQAEAIQSQGGAAYVNLKAIEKWSGILPVYMMSGGSVPFINIK